MVHHTYDYRITIPSGLAFTDDEVARATSAHGLHVGLLPWSRLIDSLRAAGLELLVLRPETATEFIGVFSQAIDPSANRESDQIRGAAIVHSALSLWRGLHSIRVVGPATIVGGVAFGASPYLELVTTKE